MSTAAPATAPEPPARRFRLLPPDEYVGWTPYAWLLYLSIFLLQPALRLRAGRADGVELALTALGVAIFLVAYFRGYWLRDRAKLQVVVVLATLGAALTPTNAGAAVFFVYATSFAAQLHRAREAVAAIAGVTLVAAASAWLLALPPRVWVGAVAFAPLLGAVGLHFAQIGRRDARLREAQAEVRHLAAVAERERIARDLHDVLGHTLSLVVLKAELAARLVERDPQRAAREMRDVEQVSRKALQEVRETIRGYRATLADEVARARVLLAAAGVRADVDVAPLALARAPEEALALALREGVTNVARHARAATCRVRVASEGGALVLEVTDDGRGGAGAAGSGLRGMRERLESLGGTVRHEPGPGGRGTRLVVTVPAAAALPPAGTGGVAAGGLPAIA